jgi:hypothetical protein
MLTKNSEPRHNRPEAQETAEVSYFIGNNVKLFQFSESAQEGHTKFLWIEKFPVTVQQGVSGDELKGELFSEEEGFEGEDGAILFVERRAAGPGGGKALGPVEGAEGADDLEFNLGHSHFAFGVIVGEWDLRIREKAQDLFFPFVQASKEVDGAGLWQFPKGGLLNGDKFIK